MKNKRCCFTGHRPEKLKHSEEEIKTLLKKEIIKAINDGYITFISGMARGVDMWAAEIVIELKDRYKDIKLICTPPFIGFEKSWKLSEQNKYNIILKKADYIKFVCEHYSKQCFQMRNCYMVEHSKRLIAVFTGEKGGTKNTIDYAKKYDKEICNVFDN